MVSCDHGRANRQAFVARRAHANRLANRFLVRETALALRATLDFLKTEAGGGVALATSALVALILANSPWAHVYFDLINAPFTIRIGDFTEAMTVRDWVKDGLMAVFYFVVGLEIKQEVLKGELSSPRKLALPVSAAVGGMIGPALIYLAFNLHGGGGAANGWPTGVATDIAFALAALALVGRGLPESLRLFLLALAIADDIGAVGLIGVLFTGHVHPWALVGAALTLAALIGISEWRDAPFLFRVIGFTVLGAFTLKSGLSTSLAGVAAALTVPIGARRPAQEGVLKHFMESVHPYVAYGVLPLFAFTAAGVPLAGHALADLVSPVTLGVAAGLFIGKQAGVMGMVFLMIRSGWARRPTGASWLELYGVALLCGVGFTMSLYIAALAFPDEMADTHAQAVLGIGIGSLLSAAGGIAVLRTAASRRRRA
jgi:NhaA family Na+:H+ antiporter